jgi:hypothetical protein
MVHVTVFMACLVHMDQNSSKYRPLKVQEAAVMHQNRATVLEFASQYSEVRKVKAKRRDAIVALRTAVKVQVK